MISMPVVCAMGWWCMRGVVPVPSTMFSAPRHVLVLWGGGTGGAACLCWWSAVALWVVVVVVSGCEELVVPPREAVRLTG